jgi:hypothetical protein
MRRPGTETLRRRVERRQKAYLWGQPHMITPRLVDEVFGDGRVLLKLWPIMYRPSYYVVRIDSKWDLSNYGDENLLADHLDEVYEAIEAQFGYIESRRAELIEDGVDPARADLAYYPELGFPVLDDGGSCWDEMDWPAEPRRRRRRRAAQ